MGLVGVRVGNQLGNHSFPLFLSLCVVASTLAWSSRYRNIYRPRFQSSSRYFTNKVCSQQQSFYILLLVYQFCYTYISSVVLHVGLILLPLLQATLFHFISSGYTIRTI